MRVLPRGHCFCPLFGDRLKIGVRGGFYACNKVIWNLFEATPNCRVSIERGFDLCVWSTGGGRNQRFQFNIREILGAPMWLRLHKGRNAVFEIGLVVTFDGNDLRRWERHVVRIEAFPFWGTRCDCHFFPRERVDRLASDGFREWWLPVWERNGKLIRLSEEKCGIDGQLANYLAICLAT